MKSKTTTFSRVFHPKKKIDNFLGKSKLNFWTKNEDLEQCALLSNTIGIAKVLFSDEAILITDFALALPD